MYSQTSGLSTIGDRLADALTWVTEVINRRAEEAELSMAGESPQEQNLRFLAAGLRSEPFVRLWPPGTQDQKLVRARFIAIRLDLERRVRALQDLDGKALPPALVAELNKLTAELGVWPWIP